MISCGCCLTWSSILLLWGCSRKSQNGHHSIVVQRWTLTHSEKIICNCALLWQTDGLNDSEGWWRVINELMAVWWWRKNPTSLSLLHIKSCRGWEINIYELSCRNLIIQLKSSNSSQILRNLVTGGDCTRLNLYWRCNKSWLTEVVMIFARVPLIHAYLQILNKEDLSSFSYSMISIRNTERPWSTDLLCSRKISSFLKNCEARIF